LKLEQPCVLVGSLTTNHFVTTAIKNRSNQSKKP
jgi:hypothetical protein